MQVGVTQHEGTHCYGFMVFAVMLDRNDSDSSVLYSKIHVPLRPSLLRVRPISIPLSQ